MKSFQKDEFKFKFETESTVRRKSSSSESHLNFWERMKSPTLEFPPGIPLQDGLYMDSNFYFQHMLISPDVVWKRPKEICEFPQFIVDGATRLDILQGYLNDCWFLSAVASLSLYPSLMERVVPPGQSFQQGYNGCFFFQFWQYGEWCKVQVDDRLPMRDGQLMFLKSSNKNEFWSSLLEKAYAKLKGGYTALNMGFPHEAMADMTGGITEVFIVGSLPRDLGSFLRRLLQKGALINCANSQGALEKSNDFGILFRHAYSVTGLETIQTKTVPVELVRVFNPWGKTEWEGPWSDKSGIEWFTVSKEEQNRVQRINLDDGEFWMALSDFRHNFDIMEVCHLSDDTLSAGSAINRPWHCTSYHGKWIPFQDPPHYKLTLLNEDDDPSDPELTCSFLLALMQKQTRKSGQVLPVALLIYKVGSEGELVSSRDLSHMIPVIKHSDEQRREVVLRGCLPPGHYIVIPATSEANRMGEFLLRVLTEKGNHTVPIKKPLTDVISPSEPLSPRLSGLPSITEAKNLFMKHCTKGSFCRPLDLYNLLTEAIAKGVFAGSEKKLSLEICKSFVVLMDSKGTGHLDWTEFLALWEKLTKWTGIFMTVDKNKNHTLEYQEIPQALTAAGIKVDDFILQLISLRYTEPDMTVSFPGFLFLLLKLDCMITKFRSFDIVGVGMITINCPQFLTMTMYN
ncbi:calpain-1 catalytic subunit-like [Triplophysa dalaica]|uniref:calpain-1 catalytic subunit-like n=1 Tax=Triplophysa dalaica TaxID=1582913 RepID=UPI0024DFA8F2|nr:calpain-1 catalytic subunit-like [Triplophysa dalaica]